jgi:uncharacterized protein (TIGR02145 family)
MNLRTWLVQGRAVMLAAVIVGAGCVSCVADTPVALVGNWVHYESATRDKPENIELFKDGTGVVDKKASVTWKVENKRFVLLSPEMALSCDYKVSGNELTLAYDGGNNAVFVRKEKMEEYLRMKEKKTEVRFEKISSYFTDSRNGQKYRAVMVGGKTWMAQNLNYKTGNSGCYGNDDSKCIQYSRLYDWKTAKTACPSGWHLPSRQEWNGLGQAVGGVRGETDHYGNITWKGADEKLKASSGWSNNGNGTDDFGFSALPGGYRDGSDSFSGVGRSGLWWTASEVREEGTSFAYAYYRLMTADGDGMYESVNHGGSSGFSVRCVMD